MIPTRGRGWALDQPTRDNIDILRRGLELLYKIDDRSYLHVKHAYSQYGIASHLRHCLDFYISFLDGIGMGRIDYDSRTRDSRLEKDRTFAIAKMESIVDALERLPEVEVDIPLKVRLEDSGDAGDPSSWSDSSVKRELQSLVSHTVHHYALIALMLQLKGFVIPEDFGVAPSTLKHWKKVSACAQ